MDFIVCTTHGIVLCAHNSHNFIPIQEAVRIATSLCSFYQQKRFRVSFPKFSLFIDYQKLMCITISSENMPIPIWAPLWSYIARIIATRILSSHIKDICSRSEELTSLAATNYTVHSAFAPSPCRPSETKERRRAASPSKNLPSTPQQTKPPKHILHRDIDHEDKQEFLIVPSSQDDDYPGSSSGLGVDYIDPSKSSEKKPLSSVALSTNSQVPASERVVPELPLKKPRPPPRPPMSKVVSGNISGRGFQGSSRSHRVIRKQNLQEKDELRRIRQKKVANPLSSSHETQSGEIFSFSERLEQDHDDHSHHLRPTEGKKGQKLEGGEDEDNSSLARFLPNTEKLASLIHTHAQRFVSVIQAICEGDYHKIVEIIWRISPFKTSKVQRLAANFENHKRLKTEMKRRLRSQKQKNKSVSKESPISAKELDAIQSVLSVNIPPLNPLLISLAPFTYTHHPLPPTHFLCLYNAAGERIWGVAGCRSLVEDCGGMGTESGCQPPMHLCLPASINSTVKGSFESLHQCTHDDRLRVAKLSSRAKFTFERLSHRIISSSSAAAVCIGGGLVADVDSSPASIASRQHLPTSIFSSPFTTALLSISKSSVVRQGGSDQEWDEVSIACGWCVAGSKTGHTSSSAKSDHGTSDQTSSSSVTSDILSSFFTRGRSTLVKALGRFIGFLILSVEEDKECARSVMDGIAKHEMSVLGYIQKDMDSDAQTQHREHRKRRKKGTTSQASHRSRSRTRSRDRRSSVGTNEAASVHSEFESSLTRDEMAGKYEEGEESSEDHSYTYSYEEIDEEAEEEAQHIVVEKPGIRGQLLRSSITPAHKEAPGKSDSKAITMPEKDHGEGKDGFPDMLHHARDSFMSDDALLSVEEDRIVSQAIQNATASIHDEFGDGFDYGKDDGMGMGCVFHTLAEEEEEEEGDIQIVGGSQVGYTSGVYGDDQDGAAVSVIDNGVWDDDW
ncbi:hypothetical protein ADUPG1_010997 [Aduncisulcus paluster]|uniref:Uncharacterized protein n=1 Tax=Aduncisulcus paluster TaxID=2918883 RepID=A0ABQ5JTV2_9EUKA|nr:hypothetical protein ADUPG1_010997 [Aduncisulcus paluster]